MLSCLLLTSCISPSVPLATATATQTADLSQSVGIPTAVVSEDTPPEEARLVEADQALSFGDYAQAYERYAQPLLVDSPEMRAAALYGQGLSWLKQGDYFQARNTLKGVQTAYPDSLPAARAYYLLGVMDVEQELYPSALDNFLAYQARRPGVLEADVNFQIGSLYQHLGENDLALSAYTQAYLAPSLSDNLAAALKVAEIYEQQGQPDRAYEIYHEFYSKSDSDWVKAQMDLLMGNLLIDKGQTEEGFAAFQDAVMNYPQTYDAYSALVALVEAGQSVDELQRGMINYYVGQYNLATEAFDRYLAGSGAEKDKALYYKALALRDWGAEKMSLGSLERTSANASGGTDEDRQAIALWNEILQNYPESAYRQDCLEDIVYTQNVYMGQISLAIETALAMVADPHMEPFAPALLWTAGLYQELDGKPKDAADTWTRIGLEFPGAAEAYNALLFGGILYYQLGEMDKAAANFNRAVLLAGAGLETAAAQLWLGKVSASRGEAAQAEQYWQNARSSDPGGYYALRAAELSEGRAPFASSGTLDFDVDMVEAYRTAASWFSYAFSIPEGVNLQYDSALFTAPEMIRGTEYWKLGLFAQASAEFEALRNRNSEDPLNTFRLLKFFVDRGFYNSAIEASKTITRLAGYADNPISGRLPEYFAYVQYGAYYLPWVQAAADKYSLPVLLVLSLIHQESHFEGHALSTAGASGLMQIMPDTGRQIAIETGFLPDFSAEDLAVPFYNLELGSNYLARQLLVFEGDTYAALAAYNAGPGNAINWQKDAAGDPDLFLGRVRYQETREYIRRIVEIFAIYSVLYTR